MRKRPGLAGVILHLAHPDVRLLENLTAYGVLDVLARLDEAGQRREHLVAVAMLVCQQAVLAVRDQHDDHRIGAREPFGLAGPASAPPAAVLDQGVAAATPAAAGVVVPLRQRPGLAA